MAVVTDIWRTESGLEERFTEPLAPGAQSPLMGPIPGVAMTARLPGRLDHPGPAFAVPPSPIQPTVADCADCIHPNADQPVRGTKSIRVLLTSLTVERTCEDG